MLLEKLSSQKQSLRLGDIGRSKHNKPQGRTPILRSGPVAILLTFLDVLFILFSGNSDLTGIESDRC